MSMVNDFEKIMIDFEKKLEESKIITGELTALLRTKTIPQRYPDSLVGEFSPINLMARDEVIKEQGYSLLTKEWISKLALWIGNRKCVEIMAGCGSLSYSLIQEGVSIIATDDFSWGKGNGIQENWNTNSNYWLEIEEIDCVKAIEKYKDADLYIMSWPYMDNTAYRVLMKIREINPNALLIYIGEYEGGCTADDSFFETLVEVRDSKFEEINYYYPSWPGIHDRLVLVR